MIVYSICVYPYMCVYYICISVCLIVCLFLCFPLHTLCKHVVCEINYIYITVTRRDVTEKDPTSQVDSPITILLMTPVLFIQPNAGTLLCVYPETLKWLSGNLLFAKMHISCASF